MEAGPFKIDSSTVSVIPKSALKRP